MNFLIESWENYVFTGVCLCTGSMSNGTGTDMDETIYYSHAWIVIHINAQVSAKSKAPLTKDTHLTD